MSLVAALHYAVRGFAVFPCLERSKAPACGRGFHDATTNPATLRRWFGSYHRYNIGIATGLISGVWALDVDGSDGAVALAELEARFGSLPPTSTVITAAGCHLWFRADRPMPTTAGRIGLHVDTRGEGGYVLAPPSLHPDGTSYRFGNDEPLALAPEWLIQRAKPGPASPFTMIAQKSPITSPTAYGRAALERECEALARAPCGTRNQALNRASFSLHQLVAGGELDLADVRNGLIDAATANGLIGDPADGPRSVEKTIDSGARAGLQHPRARPAK
jgi:Bifunctional DNA primase/polymerase, N-terminal